ncbi:hypothetical protein ECG_09950 [Echinococcus granulosus]|nr:hypothetical protein ECG_09950 [Echinococcus granulosus]
MRRLFVLMAVLYFCLVLLASSVLAQEGNEIQQGDLIGGYSAFRSIQWAVLNHTTLQISWDSEKLAAAGVHSIDASATPTSKSGNTIKKKEKVASGTITLSGLLPSTDYQLILKAFHRSAYTFEGKFKFTTGQGDAETTSTARPTDTETTSATKPTEGGKSTSTRKPTDAETTSTARPTEGKGGAATSGASVFTPTISAVLLAYVAESLA